jgi:signal transduction histidine kinase
MKIKHRLALFNGVTKIILILALIVVLPVAVQRVVLQHIGSRLMEKKQKFIEHLDDAEINDFLTTSSAQDTYARFSVLHDEFILLSKISERPSPLRTLFITEPRIIEDQQEEYRILQYTFTFKGATYELEIGSSIAEISELTFMIRVFTILIILAVVLFTFMLDTFYIEGLLKPFYRIIDTKIRRVDTPDAFDHTPIVSDTAEFTELDSVLNQMMDRIAEVFRSEKQFIANVSHELLTPISLLKSRFENLLQNESLDDAAVDKIAASLRTLNLLKQTINSLLLISRIENNQFPERVAVPLPELVGEVKEELSDRIADKGIRFTVRMAPFSFSGNRALLHILLLNIVSNAIKYNRPGGSLEVSGQNGTAGYRLIVSDSGQGMEPGQLQHIFRRFTRLDNGQEGQGLGLAIVQSIAAFHHLQLDVQSAPGKGTDFMVVFPDPAS